MNIIGVDDKKSILVTLGKMLEKIDPGGSHRFYTDPLAAVKELDKPVEVAFLDVEMPRMDGIELARQITARYPFCNIIFLTGYSDYMPTAFDIHASSYILKPFSKEKLKDALEHRRYRTPDLSDRPVKVRCFGSFEVFVNREAVKFGRRRSKELFAYFVDRRGAICSMDMIIGNIKPESAAGKAEKAKIRVYVSDIADAFRKLGIEDILVKNNGGIGINTNLLDCDYYRYLDGDPYAISAFIGEYMSQYDFAEDTRALLELKGGK